jgi:phage tail sheath protein FI
MPVEYLTPGIYVEEVDSGLKPIAGTSTSTSGFIGEVADDTLLGPQPGQFETEPDPDPAKKDKVRLKRDAAGKPIPVPYLLPPVHEPRLITSWEHFKTTFGDFQQGNLRLAHSMFGFFNNGGTRAWVARVTIGAKPEDYQAVLDKFRAIDEISILVVPGASVVVQEKMLSHCEDEYLRDRFAILDGQPVTELTKAAIQGGLRDSDHGYGAIYYPWIQVYDPVTDSRDYVPPSGHIAGIYARVDEERGVHKAPANEVIRGALGVGVKPGNAPATEMVLSKADQAGLNPHGVNVIRRFDSNINVWGARTLATDVNAEWKYINVRRLFLFIRKSIDHGTQWVVFEPNNQALWGKIIREVSAFLRRVWRSGALFGATESQAFYVKCDETINPREVRAAGQVIIEIGVAVTMPAEFVIFRISQWAGTDAG